MANRKTLREIKRDDPEVHRLLKAALAKSQDRRGAERRRLAGFRSRLTRIKKNLASYAGELDRWEVDEIPEMLQDILPHLQAEIDGREWWYAMETLRINNPEFAVIEYLQENHGAPYYREVWLELGLERDALALKRRYTDYRCKYESCSIK